MNSGQFTKDSGGRSLGGGMKKGYRYSEEDYLKKYPNSRRAKKILAKGVAKIEKVAKEEEWEPSIEEAKIINSILEFPYPWLIAGDWHIPYYSREWLEFLLEMAVKLKVNNLLIPGDWLDFEWASNFGPGSGTFNEELEAARRVIRKLKEVFSKIIIFTGNHEERRAKKTGTVIRASDWFRLYIDTPDLESGAVRVINSFKYIGPTWQVIHNGKLASQSIPDVAHKDRINTASAHTHVLSAKLCKCGDFWAIETGGMFDEKNQDWRVAQANKKSWNNGFVWIRENGSWELFDKSRMTVSFEARKKEVK